MKAEFLTRSLLYLPAHKERLMDNAEKSAADMLALDLEDSCQPASNKQLARDTIVKYVREGHFQGKKVFCRINDRESGELLRDLYQLTIQGVDGFIYPKSKSGNDVYFIGKLLETIEYEKHFPIGHFMLIPLIETTGAVVNIKEICTVCPNRVVAVGFGAEDYMSDLGGKHSADNNSIFAARSIVAMTAKSCGIAPLDIVHMDVHNMDDLEREIIQARSLGYVGKMIVHPKEIELCHKYFSPTDEEVVWAKEILQLSEEAIREGRGVAFKNNKFIGPPMVKMAEDILQMHTMIKERQPSGE